MPKEYSITVQTGKVTHTVHLPGVSEEDYDKISQALLQRMDGTTKLREAIATAFELSVDLCPDANHSDIWHHIIYRQYLRVANSQSWVRTSGEGFELFLCRYYTALLQPKGIEILSMFDRKTKAEILSAIGIPKGMGGSKLDIGIVTLPKRKRGRVVIGGVHAKGSLAERISDDVPVSMAMIQRGYWSPLCTLDVKTYPPRDLTNRGELSTQEKPTDKRNYIEQQGLFSACYSYNLRTNPSVGDTPSGKKIYRLTFQRAWDQFCMDAVSERDLRLRSL
jgi:hypothetical protein